MNTMKKLMLACVFCYTFLTAATYAYAGSTVPVDIPGQDCGVASAQPPGNKCCTYSPTKKTTSSTPGVFDVIKDIIMGFVDTVFVSPFYNVMNGQIQTVSQGCAEGVQSTPNASDSGCLCVTSAGTSKDVAAKLCNNIQNKKEFDSCVKCMDSSNGSNCIWTSLGEMPTDVSSIIQKTLLSWGIGLAGGVSMLCIIYSAFMMQTSGGNAEKVKKAQQLLTACITGLMLILFSVLILRIIGVGILRIPGFS